MPVKQAISSAWLVWSHQGSEETDQASSRSGFFRESVCESKKGVLQNEKINVRKKQKPRGKRGNCGTGV